MADAHKQAITNMIVVNQSNENKMRSIIYAFLTLRTDFIGKITLDSSFWVPEVANYATYSHGST